MVNPKKIYNKFLDYEKKRFLEDSSDWLGVVDVDKKTKQEIYNNYYKVSFYKFLTNVKNLVYLDQPFDFIKNGWGDDWQLEVYISFLVKENLISVTKNKIKIKNKVFFKLIPEIKSEQQIKEIIEKKTKIKIKNNQPITDFIKNFTDFKIKEEWDQLPLSQSSVVLSVKKILDYLPLKGEFLLVGDDDFLSVFLALTNKEIKPVVVDADKNLLDCINNIAKKLNLNIETHLIDIRKNKKLKNDFVGFLCNPPYTEKGIKEFLKYGIKQLTENGGNVFLIMGAESIGNRMFFLQKYFTDKKLLILEMIVSRLFYPYLGLLKEDANIFQKTNKYFSAQKIKENPCLGADLLIFDYIPFKVKLIKNNQSIYSYL